jgi:hypothetical protein
MDDLWDAYLLYIDSDRLYYWSAVKNWAAADGRRFGQQLAALGLQPDQVLWRFDDHGLYFEHGNIYPPNP